MPSGLWLVIASSMMGIDLFLASGNLLSTDYQLSSAPLINIAGTIFLKQKVSEFKLFQMNVWVQYRVLVLSRFKMFGNMKYFLTEVFINEVFGPPDLSKTCVPAPPLFISIVPRKYFIGSTTRPVC